MSYQAARTQKPDVHLSTWARYIGTPVPIGDHTLNEEEVDKLSRGTRMVIRPRCRHSHRPSLPLIVGHWPVRAPTPAPRDSAPVPIRSTTSRSAPRYLVNLPATTFWEEFTSSSEAVIPSYHVCLHRALLTVTVTLFHVMCLPPDPTRGELKVHLGP
jgi:hypothetical protein